MTHLVPALLLSSEQSMLCHSQALSSSRMQDAELSEASGVILRTTYGQWYTNYSQMHVPYPPEPLGEDKAHLLFGCPTIFSH